MLRILDRSSRCPLSGLVRIAIVAAASDGVLSLPLALWSQSTSSRGVIQGTVSDQQGSAVVGAQITIRSADFTSARNLVTSDTGQFTAAMLSPGAYTVEVKAPGFSLKKPARVTLGVGSTVQIAIKLGVAAVSARRHCRRPWTDG